MRSLFIAAMIAISVASSASAEIEFLIPDREPFMKTGPRTSQPIGHYKFCETYASECAVRSPLRPRARVTEAGWKVIREVNADVNQRIKPVTDDELYGQSEFWAYPVDAGDCEDYALLKRRELLARGFSEADLLIAVARRYDGSGHAVLVVSVKPWSQTPYHYLKRQSATDSGRWVEIENCPDDIPVSSIK